MLRGACAWLQESGDTALHFAVESGHMSAIRELVQLGIHKTAFNKVKPDYNNCDQCVRVLYALTLVLDSQKGLRALDIALETRNGEAVRFLGGEWHCVHSMLTTIRYSRGMLSL